MNWTTTGLEPGIARGRKPIDSAVLNVLSASTYDDSMSQTKSRFSNSDMPLGFVTEVGSGEEDKKPSRPKKRSRMIRSSNTNAGEGSDDGNKKHRGRPRIEAQDETASDRRRTQIRLAQRAYRNRKETTIATLKEQNTELQKSIARLSDTFAKMYVDLTSSSVLAGLPEALHQLEAIRKELEHASSLTFTDEQSENEKINATDRVKSRSSLTDIEQESTQNTITSSKSSTLGPASMKEVGRERSAGQSSVRNSSSSNRTLYPNNTSANQNSAFAAASYFDWNTDVMEEIDMSHFNSDTALSLPQNWSVDGMNLEKAFPQRKAYTYSFQETTFARRLHRMCLERGFRSLINPEVDPAFVARAFRFSLFSITRNSLRDNLQAILQRTAGEPLENWEKPYFHIGGAGTHYPQRDRFGKPVFPPNLQSPAIAPGPWNLLDSGSGAVSSDVIQAMLEEMGFGGDWFDAHDVEEYLKTRGIHLDGSSSYVEVDTSQFSLAQQQVINKTPSTHSSSVPTLATSPSASSQSYLNNDPTQQLDVTSMGGSTMLDALADTSMDYLNAAINGFASPYHWSIANMDTTSAPVTSPGTIPTFEQVVRRKQGIITFDVERFLERMLDGGSSCLGRAPGFRKEAVDNALALAVQEAF